MKRILIITIGIIGVLVGMGFVMPAVAQWRQEGSLTALSVALVAAWHRADLGWRRCSFSRSEAARGGGQRFQPVSDLLENGDRRDAYPPITCVE